MTTLSSAQNSNNDFIQKAATQVSTFTPGGLLLPKQQEKFVELLIPESTLLQRCKTEILPTPVYEIDKIGYLGQVVHPDEEDTAFAQNAIATPTTGKITHATKRYKAEIGLTYDTIKRVIGGDGLMDLLLSLLAKAVARDMEISALQGDTSLPATTDLNKLLRLQDGFIKQITTNSVDAMGQRLNLDILDSMEAALPDEYSDQEGLEYIVTKGGQLAFRSAVSSRATELGDQAFRTRNSVSYHDIPVNRVMLMPKDLTYNSVGGYADALLCNPKTQFLVGFLEQMSIRTGEDIRAGKFFAVMRYDVSFKILHEAACVKAVNIKNS